MADKKTILTIEVVEDERPVQKALIEKLQFEGFEVLAAPDGDEGYKLAVEKHPDLILLDLIMPKMTGIQMMHKLREADAYGKNVPIIILTNLSANDKISMEVAKDEPSYYLIKADWKIDDVVAKIKETLEF